MKRTKIMLTAITVIAVVSGALAFKVKSSPDFTICTTTTKGICNPISLPNKTAQLVNVTAFYYTVKPAGQACSQVQCPLPGDVIID
jgi:hypothetical protein